MRLFYIKGIILGFSGKFFIEFDWDENILRSFTDLDKNS
jgi:hypothetical protein